MKVVLLYASIFFSVYGITCGRNITKRSTMSDCEMIPLSLYDCDEEGYMDIQMNLITIDDNGGKAFEMTAKITEIIDESYQLRIIILRKTDDSWSDNVYEKEDSVCVYLLNYVPGLWQNLRMKIEPVIQEECSTQPGEYTLKYFGVSPTDLNIPATMSGSFKIYIYLLDQSGEIVGCKIGELEVRCDD